MSIEIEFKDAKEIIQSAFPGETSRRPVKVEVRQTYQLSDCWSGGSRNYSAFVKLDTLQVILGTQLPAEARQQVNNPFKLAVGEVLMVPGIVVVEHIIFQGKDLGFRLYLHADNMPKFLPMVAATHNLTPRDLRILVFHRGLKAGPYRQEALQSLQVTTSDLDKLVAGGYLSRNVRGAISLTTKGRQACINESL